MREIGTFSPTWHLRSSGYQSGANFDEKGQFDWLPTGRDLAPAEEHGRPSGCSPPIAAVLLILHPVERPAVRLCRPLADNPSLG
jgi:hypothetical protein